MTNPYYEGVLKPLNLKHLEAYWRTKGCRWYALMYDDARRYDAESPFEDLTAEALSRAATLLLQMASALLNDDPIKRTTSIKWCASTRP